MHHSLITLEMTMIRSVCVVCLVAGLLLSIAPAHAQKRGPKSSTPAGVAKTTGMLSRGSGNHNRSNLGSAFENRGKLYPHLIALGPTFEWPIKSQHEYVYRANPYVGIPRNMIQGRFTTNEEWEAAAGYNNPENVQVAMSDKPATWPATGWPVKAADGSPIFVSDQDSYCVYNDSTNSKQVLGLQVNQTGYAFGAKAIRDMVIYRFDIVNRSQNTYDSLFFGMYLDTDIGGSESAVDYANDKLAFNKSLEQVVYYDAGTSVQWGGSSGRFGFLMLQTPKINGVQAGITDLHYMRYDDDIDIDSVQYGIYSSAPSLYASKYKNTYFHPGANLPNIHFDDPATFPAAGIDLVSCIGSGPYRVAPGDTLHFVTAFIAGIDAAGIDAITKNAWDLYKTNFATPKPPATPKVKVVSGDGRATITWDNAAEASRDPLTHATNFGGYRIYKSLDFGQHWDQIDRNANPSAGSDPVPLASFDVSTGIQSSYIDSTLINGFTYWYSVTSYATTADGTILESSLGFSAEEQNVGVATPESPAVGRTPARVSSLTHTGTAKVSLDVSQTDQPGAGGKDYTVSFFPKYTIVKGNLQSIITLVQNGTVKIDPGTYSFAFKSPNTYTINSITANKEIKRGTYTSGAPIVMGGTGMLITLTDTSSNPDFRPQVGDSIIIAPGIMATSGLTTVMNLRPLSYGQHYATDDGIIFAVRRLNDSTNSLISYTDSFKVSTLPMQVRNDIANGELDGIKIVPNPYLIGSQYEREYGVLRREPIRELKFNHLPARCTITIFSMAGDKLKVIYHDGTTGSESWDLRTDGNRVIAAGMYVYLVKTDTAEKFGRFAVIK
jgi:hypothetical protein